MDMRTAPPTHFISTPLYKDSANDIWRADGLSPISYSDGAKSEQYLKHVLSKAQDLGSDSTELESYIRDWSSEYHLSSKRSLLLQPFQFPPEARVLEVGAGCGAITRFLGERFSQVIAIEGSMQRAQLARMRTTGQDNVEIVCAPFHQLSFKQSFDLLFCIGVFEYAPLFVEAEDPFAHILSLFQKILAPNGTLVLAIENQFGLKYFASSTEDHTRIMFDGIEGYHRQIKGPRTFGHQKLKQKIADFFPSVNFYYPYPDYKLPQGVFTEGFLNTTQPVELLGRLRSRDYQTAQKPLFNEQLALAELASNNALPFFANSFLVLACGNRQEEIPQLEENADGVLFNTDREKPLRTRTWFLKGQDETYRCRKSLPGGVQRVTLGSLSLEAGEEPWKTGHSLQSVLFSRLRQRVPFESLFVPCMVWLERIRSCSIEQGQTSFIPGGYFDAIWSNFLFQETGGEFIDLEWRLTESFDYRLLIFRSILTFLDETKKEDVFSLLPSKNYLQIMKQLFALFNIPISDHELKKFCKQQTTFSALVFGNRGQDYSKLFRFRLFR